MQLVSLVFLGIQVPVVFLVSAPAALAVYQATLVYLGLQVILASAALAVYLVGLAGQANPASAAYQDTLVTPASLALAALAVYLVGLALAVFPVLVAIVVSVVGLA